MKSPFFFLKNLISNSIFSSAQVLNHWDFPFHGLEGTLSSLVWVFFTCSGMFFSFPACGHQSQLCFPWFLLQVCKPCTPMKHWAEEIFPKWLQNQIYFSVIWFTDNAWRCVSAIQAWHQAAHGTGNASTRGRHTLTFQADHRSSGSEFTRICTPWICPLWAENITGRIFKLIAPEGCQHLKPLILFFKFNLI